LFAAHHPLLPLSHLQPLGVALVHAQLDGAAAVAVAVAVAVVQEGQLFGGHDDVSVERVRKKTKQKKTLSIARGFLSLARSARALWRCVPPCCPGAG
jgi:hypothetical protein